MSDEMNEFGKKSQVTRQAGPNGGETKFVQPLPKKARRSLDGSAKDMSDIQEKASSEKPRTTFKALGNVVLAMKRFQASLNPTYTYGKQQSPLHHSTTTSSSYGGLETSVNGQQYSFPDRGHRSDLLLRRLPDIDDEVKSKQKDLK